jgi:hypothetical protein
MVCVLSFILGSAATFLIIAILQLAIAVMNCCLWKQ